MPALLPLPAACVAAAGLGGAGAVAAPVAAVDHAPSRLAVSAHARTAATRPGVMVLVFVRVRNAGIADLTDVRVAGRVRRNASIVTKERGAAPSTAPGELSDLPVGVGRTFPLRLHVDGSGTRACGTVRISATGARPALATACVPLRVR